MLNIWTLIIFFVLLPKNRYLCRGKFFCGFSAESKWVLTESNGMGRKNKQPHGVSSGEQSLNNATSPDYKKLYEQEQEKYRQLYDGLFWNQRTAMFILDPETKRIVDANRAAVDFYGYPLEELLQMTVFDINPLEDRKEVEHHMEQALRSEKNIFEVRHKRADGTVRHVEVRSVKVMQDEKVLYYVSVYDITPRIKARQDLQQSEVKFRKAFTISPDAIAITHLKTGRYLEVNDGFLNETGYTREEVLGKTALELGFWVDYKQREEMMQVLIKKGSVENYPAKLRIKNGTVIQALVSSNPIEIDGEPYLISLTRNVEDYEKALQALQHSEQRYKTLFNLSPVGIILIDEQGTLLDANPAFCGLLSYSPDEIIGKKVWEALFPVAVEANKEDVLKSIRAIIRSNKPLIKEVVNYAKDGTPFYFRLYETAIKMGDGKKVILSISMDITKEKAYRDALAQQASRLKEAQEIGGLGSWELIWQKRQLIWSEGIYQILELDDTVKPGYGTFQKFIHPDDLNAARKVLKDSMRTGKPFKHIHRLLLKNGTVKWVIERGKSFYNDKGELVRTHGTVQDITRLKEAEDQLKELNELLEKKVIDRTAKLKRKQQYLSEVLKDMKRVQEKLKRSNQALQHLNHELESFSYSVSHDLKAPLRAIQGFAVILKEDYYDRLDLSGRELVDDIVSETRRMSEIIEALLLLSRTSRKNLNYVEFDPKPLVQSVFMEQKKHFNLPGARLETGSLPHIFADYSLIKQLLANLFSNALKYSSKEPEPVVKFGYEPDDGKEMDVFFLKDNGVGFDEKTSAKMFRAFHRLHSSKDFDGTGIGLAIAQRIVTRHGGKIWASGKKGKGATLYFSLPKKPKTL